MQFNSDVLLCFCSTELSISKSFLYKKPQQTQNSMNDRSKSVYTEACMFESMRFSIVVGKGVQYMTMSFFHDVCHIGVKSKMLIIKL